MAGKALDVEAGRMWNECGGRRRTSAVDEGHRQPSLTLWEVSYVWHGGRFDRD